MEQDPTQNQALQSEPKKIPEFSKLLKRAFEITRYNKFLWILGILAGLGGGGFRGNFGSFGSGGGSSSSVENETDEFLNTFDAFVSEYWEALLIAAILLLAIVLVLVIIGIVSRGGLIGAINDIDEGKATNFSSAFKSGTISFWRLVGVNIVVSLVVFLAVLVIATPVIYLVIIESYAAAIALGLLGILLLIAISIFLSLIHTFASIGTVLAHSSVFTAISDAYELVMSNRKSIGLSWLIAVGIGILEGVALLVALLPLIALAVVGGTFLYLSLSGVGLAIAVGFFVLIAILVSAFVRGLWEAYLQAFWILVFKEIKDEKIKGDA